jgi:hypothetical protein
MWKEKFVLEVLSWYFPGGIEENHKKLTIGLAGLRSEV